MWTCYAKSAKSAMLMQATEIKKFKKIQTLDGLFSVGLYHFLTCILVEYQPSPYITFVVPNLYK